MADRTKPVPVCIVGGGVSGLAAAYFLHRRGVPVRVFEAGPRLGGNIRTEHHDGFLYDIGPDSFLRTKPMAADLCKELGLGDDLIAPSDTSVFVARDGVLHPMPEGLSLGVPTKLSGLIDTKLLSGEGKLRAMWEPFVPPRREDDEESIQQFTRRRLGQEMADNVAAPLLSGVFAGDASQLSMSATFPQLVALEKKYGSLFRGMSGGQPLHKALLEPRKKPASPFLSLRGGLGTLVDRLLERLPEGSVFVGRRIHSLSAGPRGATLEVETEGGRETVEAQHVVFAGPPWSAQPVLGQLSPSLARVLGAIRGSATATAFFGLRKVSMHSDPQGSGFIVPPGEGQILAATWTSSKWEGRAPDDAVLMRAFVGGARGQGDLQVSDEKLLATARAELERFMGALGKPVFERVFRWEKGTPQPELGHDERLSQLRDELRHFPWLSLVGSGYGGVGIPDCVRQAREVAEQLAPEAESSLESTPEKRVARGG